MRLARWRQGYHLCPLSILDRIYTLLHYVEPLCPLPVNVAQQKSFDDLDAAPVI
jgi:hypothetical protein